MSNKSMAENKQNPSTSVKKVTPIIKENFSFVWSINNFGEFLDRKYEFRSPLFISNTPGATKWKLVLFPEIVYPEGLQIVLRLYNVSNDDKCYSVNYSVSLLDKNGVNQSFQYREKVFRHHLDYDQFAMVSNRTIKDKNLLQSDGMLTICCEMDLFFCEVPDDETSRLPKSHETINVSDENDISLTEENITISENFNSFSAVNDLSAINKKLTKCDNTSNYLFAINDLSYEIPCKETKVDLMVKKNDVSKTTDNVLPVSMEKMHLNNENFKLNQGCMVFSNEYDRKTKVQFEKNEWSFNKNGEPKESCSLKNLEGLDTLSKDFNFLYTTKYYSDVIINTKDGQLRAHKAILGARSEYFRTILAQDQEEIQILGINTATFDAILFYMYTGQSPRMTFNLGLDILSVCDQFYLDHLKIVTKNFIKSQMDVSNVIDIFQIATEMKLENLKMSALKYIAENNKAVTNSAKWSEMMSVNPHGAGEILLTIAALSKQQTIK